MKTENKQLSATQLKAHWRLDRCASLAAQFADGVIPEDVLPDAPVGAYKGSGRHTRSAGQNGNCKHGYGRKLSLQAFDAWLRQQSADAWASHARALREEEEQRRREAQGIGIVWRDHLDKANCWTALIHGVEVQLARAGRGVYRLAIADAKRYAFACANVKGGRSADARLPADNASKARDAAARYAARFLVGVAK